MQCNPCATLPTDTNDLVITSRPVLDLACIPNIGVLADWIPLNGYHLEGLDIDARSGNNFVLSTKDDVIFRNTID